MTPHKKAYMKEYDSKNKEHKLAYMKEYYLKNKEKKLKYSNEYNLNNKERIKERKKKYELKHKEKRRKLNKEYYSKNKEQRKEYNLKWRLENKEWRRDYGNKRYKTNINYKIRCNLGTRMRSALKGKTKAASTMKLIGCTLDKLRSHLESLFEPWMTWENQGRGGWDIDHIKACAKFNLIDPVQQRKCFNWSNLQPMDHIANIKKGAR